MFGTIFLNDFDKFIIFFFAPNTLFDAISSLLIISIETLSVISPRDESGNLLPIILLEVFGLDALTLAKLIYCPDKQLVLIF